jgi:ribosomal protein S18 acetylase RimI-like enzyme
MLFYTGGKMAEPRLLKLPDEIDTFLRLTREGFQYPENPDWSLQNDEAEEFAGMVNNIRRIWPLVALLRRLSPDMRDAFYGLVYEEEGQPAGITLYQRRSGSPEWFIANVAVLPAFRRRGIARKLVEAALAAIRSQHGQTAILDVIDGNLPAFQLYQRLGFEHFSGSTTFYLDQKPEEKEIPPGYQLSPLDLNAWPVFFDLARRITPPAVQRFVPVRERAFREPLVMRWFGDMMNMMEGSRRLAFALRAPDGQVAGIATCSTRPRASSGLSYLHVSHDPAHPAAASYLLAHAACAVRRMAPIRRIEFTFPDWQPELIHAAQEMGAQPRYAYLRMGLSLV